MADRKLDWKGEKVTSMNPEVPVDLNFPVNERPLKYDRHGSTQFADRKSRRLIIIADPLKDLVSPSATQIQFDCD